MSEQGDPAGPEKCGGGREDAGRSRGARGGGGVGGAARGGSGAGLGERGRSGERGGRCGDDARARGRSDDREAQAAGERGRSGERGGREVVDGEGDGEPKHPPRRIPPQARIAAAILGPVLLTTAYFTIPFGVLGPRHRVLAWLILAGLLALLAVGMVVTTNRALADDAGRFRHPGVGILLLSWAAILVFAASYWAMATRHGEFVGLRTRLDALYFTGVTMATVGYGDIHPSGQLARGVVLVQFVYTFAFLVSGVTAVRTRARGTLMRRIGG